MYNSGVSISTHSYEWFKKGDVFRQQPMKEAVLMYYSNAVHSGNKDVVINTSKV